MNVITPRIVRLNDALQPNSRSRFSRPMVAGGRLMAASARLIPLALSLALASAAFGAGSARGQDTCLDAPNAPAPPGSHWYYRTDKSTQRKCWYVRSQDQPQGQAVQTTPVPQQRPATADSAATPESTSGKAAPDRAEQDLSAHRAQGASAAAGSGTRAGRQANIGAPKWNDPQPPAGETTFAWPAPPVLPVDAANAIQAQPAAADPGTPAAPASPGPAADSANSAPASPPAAATADTTGATQATDKPAATSGRATVWQGDTPLGMILAVVIALLIAGALMRLLLIKALAHRRAIHVDRQEPVLLESVAAKGPVPTLLTPSPDLVPSRADTDPRFDELEELLHKLAQRLSRPRATPFKIIKPFFPRESAAARVRQ